FQQQANEHNVSQFMQVNDFYRYQVDAATWNYNSENVNFEQLGVPLIPVQNVATAITALNCLDVELTQSQLNKVLETVALPGRMQVVSEQPVAMVDVAHNSHAINYLLSTIEKSKRFESITDIRLVIGMMRDKDIKQSLSLFKGKVSQWYLGDIPNNSRAAAASELAEQLRALGEQNVHVTESIQSAWLQAKSEQTQSSLLLGVGSFYTVAEILSLKEV
ncbi:MAG: hypothetical protein HWE10_03760, partial [Gammaproteobacteria bacterium]|nr:hypothetical protein [Gammaproteobacteria bacterium]